MKWLRTDVNNFRMKRKCSTEHYGSWTFLLGTLMLLLTVSHVSCGESEEIFNDDFNAGDYDDVDNVEWHHVKIVDGILQPEDHPVIFYKEDIVNEDYDPAKDKRKNVTAPDTAATGHRTRKYKDITRRHRYNRTTDAEKYRAIKPEKTYFDILPQAPVVTAADDSNANDSRFDTSKIRVEIMSLADDINVNDNAANGEESEAESKQILSKRPKKYRRRQRRDTTSEVEHKVRKRNPYYVNGNTNNNVFQYLQSIFAASNQQQGSRKYPVKGNYWNALSVPIDTSEVNLGPRGSFEPDRVIWSVSPNRPSRVLPPIFRDPNQNNIDSSSPTRRPSELSHMTTRHPFTVPPLIRDPNRGNADSSFTTTRRPFTVPPLIRNPNQSNADSSSINSASGSNGSNQRDTPQQDPGASTQTKEPQRRRISQCVWAIVSCCSRENLTIRNDCFEAMDCGRNFWGLNPCADNIQDQALEYVENNLE